LSSRTRNFPLFEEASSNLIELASNLRGCKSSLKKKEVLFSKIDALEQKERILRQTNLELSRNFITPFDREDIHSLITSIDNVADRLHGASSIMRLYQVDKLLSQFVN
jgi:uncharacterized protein Yka (UPF0111/DUF47 family)